MDIDMSRRNKTPRPLSDKERSRLEEYIDSIHYSNRYYALGPTHATRPHRQRRNANLELSPRYNDSEYEYRHVQLPKAMLKAIPEDYQDAQKGTLKLLWEEEWRALGITQSLGWEHYEVHEPEPHILLFK
ncbi:hypothetical protein MY10362_001693 [Beauveria mimosiformis]